MNATTIVTAIGQCVAGFPDGANKEHASVAIIRNGDLNFVAVFTDGEGDHEGGIALNVVGVPLVSLEDDSLPGYVLDAVAKSAADYRGKQAEGLVP